MVIDSDSYWRRPPSQDDHVRFERAVYSTYSDGCGCDLDGFGGRPTTCDFHRYVEETPAWFNRLVWIRRELNRDGTLADREGSWLLTFVADPPVYHNGSRIPDVYEVLWGAKIRGDGRRS